MGSHPLRVATLTAIAACLLATPGTALAADDVIGGPALGQPGFVVGTGTGVPPLPATTSTSFVVADADTGAVLAAHNAHQRLAPASTPEDTHGDHAAAPARRRISDDGPKRRAERRRHQGRNRGRHHVQGRRPVHGDVDDVGERRGRRAVRRQRRGTEDARRDEPGGRPTPGERHGGPHARRARRRRPVVVRLRPRSDLPRRPGDPAVQALPRAEDRRFPSAERPELPDPDPRQAAHRLPRHDRRQERLHGGRPGQLRRARRPAAATRSSSP